ncbi:PEP-utilizing enzyme [Calothrix sp. NIES-4071]|nr:PEP-utilizing enzyme [Calothrix sp. NIES-4071]BAZ58468.1 PEP-utilizing enzyme [Calothrix sp. NIES-4105]
MERLYWLNQIKHQDQSQVGDKAFNLSRLLQHGYPVAPGFVISADVTRDFLLNLNTETLITDLPYSELHLDINNWRQLQQVASSLRQEIMTANVPAAWVEVIFDAASQWQANCLIFRPTVAISSKTAIENLSGLLESQVCWCNVTDIAASLKRSWSQLFRARSLLYCQQAGIDLRQVNFGILVQPLWEATKSGLLVANSSGLEIQANWGLEIAIAQGEVNGDYYKIKPDGTILEQALGDKILAYKVKDCYQASTHSDNIIEPESSCLITSLLDISEQQKFALSQDELKELLKLSHQLQNELGTTFSYKWIILKSNETLYLTQVTLPEFTASNSLSPLIKGIKGLGAASGQVIGTAYVITNFHEQPLLPKDTILVAGSITIDWLPLMRSCIGIITEYGGLTSHAAILARELGIPAVVNANKATELIKNGDKLTINGDNGEIKYVEFSTLSPLKNSEQSFISQDASMQIATATQLMVNLSQTNVIEQVQSLPIDGVGLLRSELMVTSFINEQNLNILHNQERRAEFYARWYEQILQFAKAFTPRPIFYRSLDLHSNKIATSSLSQSLGRGTFSYVQNSEIFEFELDILAQVYSDGFDNLRLILPFVRSVEEFIFCRQKVEKAGLTRISQFELWIMAEVPSVLFMLPEYIKAGIQGIAIGTNDLTQLLLGVDRELLQLKHTLDERNPAVMRAIRQLIETARAYKIPCSICGQAPVLYPEIIDQLVQWGITSISVEPEAILRTYRAIARAEQRIILEASRQKITD